MTWQTWIAALVVLAAPSMVMAQQEAGPNVHVTGVSEKDFPKITVQYELVKPDGSFLRDARPRRVPGDRGGREVPIVNFLAPITTEQIPTTLVLLVDHSGSMRMEDRIVGMKEAVAAFLERLPAGSRVAVVAFATEVERLVPFTTDLGRVREAVNGLEADGATMFYDAVDEALSMLDGESGRRAVLAMTDGEDQKSRHASLGGVIRSATRLGLPVYTLGLGSEREIRSADLRRLADETRARYYPARRADELKAIYEQIAERIGSGYVLTYRTDRPVPDGTLRPIRISYRDERATVETAVFIPGMVVPAAGWSQLFLGMAAALAALLLLPTFVRSRRATPG